MREGFGLVVAVAGTGWGMVRLVIGPKLTESLAVITITCAVPLGGDVAVNDLIVFIHVDPAVRGEALLLRTVT